MTTKRNQIEEYTVTFRFRGHKAETIANMLFIQWLDGGLADGFEDLAASLEAVEMSHDWDPASRTFDISVEELKPE